MFYLRSMWGIGKNVPEKKQLTLYECLDREDHNKKHTRTYVRVYTLSIIIVAIVCLCLYHYIRLEHSRTGLRNITDILEVHDHHFGESIDDKKQPTEIYWNQHHPSIISYSAKDNELNERVAILVPYRDRRLNLEIFLNNIHYFLIRQKLNFTIFIIEQFGTYKFNRGRLFNAGYQEIKKLGNWSCLVFHDVDLLPLDDRISYSCPKWPLLLCSTIVGMKESFRTLFGGVSAMTSQQFERVNGYSNLYWGWGGEDNDLFWRIRAIGYPVMKYNKTIARYESLKHTNQIRNKSRYRLLNNAKIRLNKDGLSSIMYKVVDIKLHDLYTHITVDVDEIN